MWPRRRCIAVRRNESKSEMIACPNCGRQLADKAVLCIQCGHDFRTGKRLTVQIDRPPDYVEFAVSAAWCTLTILAGWIVCFLLSAFVWLLGEGRFSERLTTGIFAAGAALAALWTLVTFRRRTRVVARRDEANRSIVELNYSFGFVGIRRRLELSGCDTVYLFQIPHHNRSSLTHILLGVFKLSILAPFLLGEDHRRGVAYRIECRSDHGAGIASPLLVLRSDEAWSVEMSATARHISEILKMPLVQELGLFN